MLTLDNGGEFQSDECVRFCRQCGIRWELTTPYSPEQNNVAKRVNQTIQEWIVAMMQHTGLSCGFWAEALLTIVHIINMSPSTPRGLQILQELWTSQRPNYEKLRIFEYEAFALVPKDNRQKLESRSRKCIFLGYGSEGAFGHRLWDLENRQIVWSSNVLFNESKMHKPAERPIEVRRVTFSDALTPHDGAAEHTRAATRQAASTN